MPGEQLQLSGLAPAPAHFDGESYEPECDASRLASQLAAVRGLMLAGGWWTISRLIDAIWKQGGCATQQSISARIRDLRKARFGGYQVDRRRSPGSPRVFEYRIHRK